MALDKRFSLQLKSIYLKPSLILSQRQTQTLRRPRDFGALEQKGDFHSRLVSSSPRQETWVAANKIAAQLFVCRS
jgi:hypothetical protein